MHKRRSEVSAARHQLDELLAERDDVNQKLQEIIDLQTEPWGVKVRAVEVKQIDLPPDMQRAMAKQAEAEREKRAKVIHAEGEFQAAEQLANAARVISTEPATLQLRYLQTLAEIATENNSTTIFPIPIDILRPFYENLVSNAAECSERPRRSVIDGSRRRRPLGRCEGRSLCSPISDPHPLGVDAARRQRGVGV